MQDTTLNPPKKMMILMMIVGVMTLDFFFAVYVLLLRITGKKTHTHTY